MKALRVGIETSIECKTQQEVAGTPFICVDPGGHCSPAMKIQCLPPLPRFTCLPSSVAPDCRQALDALCEESVHRRARHCLPTLALPRADDVAGADVIEQDKEGDEHCGRTNMYSVRID